MFDPAGLMLTGPLHTPATKLPVVAGVGLTREGEPKRMSGRVEDVLGEGDDVPDHVSGLVA